MKKTSLILSIIFLLCTSFSCAQSENPPFIENADESKIYLQKIVDGIDIPWGISFINENEILITDKKGILYHVKDNIKTAVQGLPKVVENSTQGSGQGKEIPEQKLSNMGQDLNQKVNAFQPPEGFKNFDLNGLDQDQINLAVGQAKDFAQSVGQDFKDSPIIDEVKTFGESVISQAQNNFEIPE